MAWNKMRKSIGDLLDQQLEMHGWDTSLLGAFQRCYSLASSEVLLADTRSGRTLELMNQVYCSTGAWYMESSIML